METVELASPPSLASLYARALTVSLAPGGGDALPDRELLLRGVEPDRERVAAYCRVCGFGFREVVPGTYPHVLAFPMHLRLMTDRSFPFAALGLVHIANRIDVLAPIRIDSLLAFSLRAEDLRPHPRGTQFDLVVEATLEDRPAWRSRSTYLRRGKGEGEGSGAGDAAADPEDPPLTTSAIWRVPGDIGRRYAGVSGDRNPIHMHPLSARAFGFPTAIAHGMWSKARCLAAFEGRLPDAYSVAVEFRSPLRIPGKARFLSGPRGDGFAFRLETPDGEHTHLVGSVTPGSRP